MFKSILLFLDKKHDGAMVEKVLNTKEVQRYYLHLGGSIVFLVLTCIIILTMVIKSKQQLHPTFVTQNNQEFKEVVSLPYPVQSMKNVQLWVMEAIMATYAFNFNNFDESMDNAAYFFTTEGYVTFLNAIKDQGIREKVKKDNLIVSIIPISNPIFINGSNLSDGGEFWRFRVPAMVSVTSGKDKSNKKYSIDVLVLRVPGHKSVKALGIAEFSMKEY